MTRPSWCEVVSAPLEARSSAVPFVRRTAALGVRRLGTDLGFMIRVEGTAAGTVREYCNEPATPAATITRVRTFAACAG